MTSEMSAQIRQFIELVIDESAADLPMTPAVRERMVVTLKEEYDAFLTRAIVSRLSREQALEFARLYQEQRPASEIQAWLTAHVPDYQHLTLRATHDFRNRYLERARQRGTAS